MKKKIGEAKMFKKTDDWLKEHKTISFIFIICCTILSICSAISLLTTTYLGKNIIMDYDFYESNYDYIKYYIKETPELLRPNKIILYNEVIPKNKDLIYLGTYRKYLAGIDIIRIYSDQDLFNTYWHEIGHKLWYIISDENKSEYKDLYEKGAKTSNTVEEDFAISFACYISRLKPKLPRNSEQSYDYCEYYYMKEKDSYFNDLKIIK